MKEVRAGRLSDPRPLDTKTAGAECLAPRYALFEQHGGGPRKVRVVDDLRASAADAITDMRGASIPDSMGVFSAVASYFRLLQPAREIRASTDDFCHAYKNIVTPTENAPCAAVLLGPTAGLLMVSKLRTQPFGSTRAPANWGRVTALIQRVLITYFGAYLPIYVDDCFIVEPAETIHIAFLRTKLAIEMFGFELGGSQIPSRPINLLGASISRPSP